MPGNDFDFVFDYDAYGAPEVQAPELDLGFLSDMGISRPPTLDYRAPELGPSLAEVMAGFARPAQSDADLNVAAAQQEQARVSMVNALRATMGERTRQVTSAAPRTGGDELGRSMEPERQENPRQFAVNALNQAGGLFKNGPSREEVLALIGEIGLSDDEKRAALFPGSLPARAIGAALPVGSGQGLNFRTGINPDTGLIDTRDVFGFFGDVGTPSNQAPVDGLPDFGAPQQQRTGNALAAPAVRRRTSPFGDPAFNVGGLSPLWAAYAAGLDASIG